MALAMPWPRFRALCEALETEGPSNGASELDKAKAIQNLYQQHRAGRSGVSVN